MKGVILDAGSLGPQTDLTPITSLLDDWQVFNATTPDQVQARVRDADVVLSNKIRVDRDNLQGSHVAYISVMATGTNNVDLEYAHQQGIPVSNAVGYATPSVTQHTLTLILTLATSLNRYVEDVRQGAWQTSPVFCVLDHPISEVAGKTLGIVGHGELGSSVARAAQGLGMEIVISARPDETAPPGRTAFEETLAQADYLSLHCPLTAQTAHIINARTLRLMKPSAFLINTARGGLVDSEALIAALQEGTIAGAAIDVLDTEPAAPDEPLLRENLPNLIVTPHNAWAAIESRQRLVEQMRENIEGFLAGAPPRPVTWQGA